MEWASKKCWNSVVVIGILTHKMCSDLITRNCETRSMIYSVIVWTVDLLHKLHEVSRRYMVTNIVQTGRLMRVCWSWLMFRSSCQCGVLLLEPMQGALDSSTARARPNHPASSPTSSNLSVLGLLQAVCTNPGAVLSAGESHSQSAQPYAPPSLMETVVKQLLQLAATSTSATNTSTPYYVTGAGSPLKNGVRACTCIVHLVLLQVWIQQDGYELGLIVWILIRMMRKWVSVYVLMPWRLG